MGEQTKVFITGATGFVGKHFMNRLKLWTAPEALIYALVRKDTTFEDPRVIPLKGDLGEVEKYQDIIRSCDYIFHLAANVNFFGGTSDDDRVNFESTKKLVDIVGPHPEHLKNFVFISTIGAVDRHKDDNFSSPLTVQSIPAPTTQYGKSKLKSEEYIKQSTIPFTIIRPTWVYGEHMRSNSHINKFVSMVYSQSPVHRLEFPGRVSLIHVSDLVTSMVYCIGHQGMIGKTYFAATEEKSIGEIFRIIYQEIHGKELKQIKVPGFFRSVIKKIHNWIPLTVANLFVDYLHADGQAYIEDFAIHSPKQFRDNVGEVVKSNTSIFKQVSKYKKQGFGFFGAWLKHSLYPMHYFKKILPERGTMLDLGCGEGMLTNLIAQTAPGLQITGVDKDDKRIEQAKNASSTNSNFICQSIEDVSVVPVDAIIINDVLHHHGKEKQKVLLQKALICLKDGGTLIVKEVDKEDALDSFWTKFWDKKLYPHDILTFRTPEEWTLLLKELGCTKSDRFRVKHFWPASRTILVYQKDLRTS